MTRRRRAHDGGGVRDGRPTFADGRISGEVSMAGRRADAQSVGRRLDPAQLRDPVERHQVIWQ